MNGERLVSWWVDRYTRGLEPSVREERRAELASDLWEHRAAEGDRRLTQLAIASRCLRGIPADLSWRRAARGRRGLPSRSAIVRGAGWAIAGSGYLFLVLLHGWVASALIGWNHWAADQDPGDVRFWSRLCALLLATLVGGAVLLRLRPWVGVALVGGAAFATAAVMWWFAPVLVPVASAVTGGAVALARGHRRPAAVGR